MNPRYLIYTNALTKRSFRSSNDAKSVDVVVMVDYLPPAALAHRQRHQKQTYLTKMAFLDWPMSKALHLDGGTALKSMFLHARSETGRAKTGVAIFPIG